MLFVSLGLTFHSHKCETTGEVIISVNEKVECQHAKKQDHKDEVKHACCHHHSKTCSHKAKKEKKKGGCCHDSQFTVLVKLDKLFDNDRVVSVTYHALPFTYILDFASQIVSSDEEQDLLRPPPDIGVTGRTLLTEYETFLI